MSAIVALRRAAAGRCANPASPRRRAPAAARRPRPARSARTRRLPRSAGGTSRRSDRRRGHAGRLGARPVRGESLVGVIAALGRLDPGESDAAGGHRAPVDIALDISRRRCRGSGSRWVAGNPRRNRARHPGAQPASPRPSAAIRPSRTGARRRLCCGLKASAPGTRTRGELRTAFYLTCGRGGAN